MGNQSCYIEDCLSVKLEGVAIIFSAIWYITFILLFSTLSLFEQQHKTTPAHLCYYYIGFDFKFYNFNKWEFTSCVPG